MNPRNVRSVAEPAVNVGPVLRALRETLPILDSVPLRLDSHAQWIALRTILCATIADLDWIARSWRAPISPKSSLSEHPELGFDDSSAILARRFRPTRETNPAAPPTPRPQRFAKRKALTNLKRSARLPRRARCLY